jgi:hypothetical protein
MNDGDVLAYPPHCFTQMVGKAGHASSQPHVSLPTITFSTNVIGGVCHEEVYDLNDWCSYRSCGKIAATSCAAAGLQYRKDTNATLTFFYRDKLPVCSRFGWFGRCGRTGPATERLMADG